MISLDFLLEMETTVIDPFADPRHLELTAFGVPVRLIVGGRGRDEAVEQILTAWARCDVRELTPAETETEFSGPALGAVLDPDEAVHEAAWALNSVAAESTEILASVLTSSITGKAIEAARAKLVMIHAAGLADIQTGRTAILVGPSGAGKSTVSRVLGKHFGYVSDETVSFNVDGQILPYPKPLALFPEGRTWGKLQHSPEQLGLLEAPASLELGAIVFLSRADDGPTTPQVEEVSTCEAIALVAQQTSYFAELDRPLHRVAELIKKVGPAVKISYRDAGDLQPVLTELLARPAVDSEDSHVVAPALTELDYQTEPFGRIVGRTELLDFYVDHDGAVALTPDGRAVALSALAARIMTLIGETPTTLAPVAEALTDEFGAPESEMDQAALRLADDVVADLIGSGLLTHVE